MHFPPRRVAVYLILAAVGLAADLWTKAAVFDAMGLPGDRGAWWLIDGVLGIQTAVNLGAVFGIGQGKGLAFAAFSVVAIGGILVWLTRFGGFASWFLTATLGMITGGVLGNLYDRLSLWGPPEVYRSGVRDWILFRLDGVPLFDPWPNFNLADSYLVVGAVLLFVYSWRNPGGDGNAEPAME